MRADCVELEEKYFCFFQHSRKSTRRGTSKRAARRVSPRRLPPRVSAMPMHVLRVPSTDGVVLQVQDRGVWYPPSGASTTESHDPVTMLLVHANGFHGRVFDPVVKCLFARARHRGRAVRVISFDMRAHGGSTVPVSWSASEKKNNLRWNKFADDVLAVVGFVKNAKLNLHVIGHSLGAHASLRAEARCPGTFKSIYAFEPIFMVDAAKLGRGNVFSPDFTTAARKRKERFASKATALAVFKSKPPMNAFHAKAVASYVEYGFVEDTGDTSTATNDGEKQTHGAGVRLAMSKENEALVFANGGEEREVNFLLCDADGASLITCPHVTIARGSTQAGHDKSLVPFPAAMAPIVANVTGGALETHSEWNHFGPLCDPESFTSSVWEHCERSERAGSDPRSLALRRESTVRARL